MKFPLPILLLVAGPAALSAQTRPSPLAIGGGHQFSSDLDDGGSFSVSTLRIQGGIPLFLRDDTTIALNAGYQFDNYDFDDSLIAPWSDVHRARIGLFASTEFRDDWTLFAAPFAAASFETGADLGESITFGGVAAAWNRVNNRLSLGLGAGAVTVLEDDVAIFPLAVIIWEIVDDVTFSTLPPEGFRFLPGAHIQWDASDDLSLSLVYQFQFDQQRLDGSTPITDDGLSEVSQHIVSLAATYRFTESFAVTGHVGVGLAGEIEIQNSSGDRVEEDDFDTSLIVGFEGAFRF